MNTKNTKPTPRSTEEWIDSLSQPDKDSMQEVWDIAGKSAPVLENQKTMSDEDAKVLMRSKIQQHINGAATKDPVEENPETKSGAPIFRLNAYMAAAAILLIAAGLTVWQVWFTSTTHYAPFGSTLTVTLDDQTSVELNSGSTMTIRRGFADRHRDVALTGEAYFDVTAGELPFRVSTHNATVEVLGTRFNVRSWPDELAGETSVALESGAVSFFRVNHEDERLELLPGQASRISGLQVRPSDPTDDKFEDLLAWRARNIAFTARPLSSVITELERRFDVSIELDSDRRNYRSRQVTAYYTQPETIDIVLNDIAESLGLKAKTENGKYVIY